MAKAMNPRDRHILCATGSIVVGLLVRRFAANLSFLGEYGPDAIWAMMVYFLIAFIAPRAAIWKTGIAALAFAFTVELTQLYHAPWIDNIRSYRLGGLVLGYGFLWSDLACYIVGVGLACAIDASLTRLAISRNQ